MLFNPWWDWLLNERIEKLSINRAKYQLTTVSLDWTLSVALGMTASIYHQIQLLQFQKMLLFSRAQKLCPKVLWPDKLGFGEIH